MFHENYEDVKWQPITAAVECRPDFQFLRDNFDAIKRPHRGNLAKKILAEVPGCSHRLLAFLLGKSDKTVGNAVRAANKEAEMQARAPETVGSPTNGAQTHVAIDVKSATPSGAPEQSSPRKPWPVNKAELRKNPEEHKKWYDSIWRGVAEDQAERRKHDQAWAEKSRRARIGLPR